jgi:hypothetical protein
MPNDGDDERLAGASDSERDAMDTEMLEQAQETAAFLDGAGIDEYGGDGDVDVGDSQVWAALLYPSAEASLGEQEETSSQDAGHAAQFSDVDRSSNTSSLEIGIETAHMDRERRPSATSRPPSMSFPQRVSSHRLSVECLSC